MIQHRMATVAKAEKSCSTLSTKMIQMTSVLIRSDTSKATPVSTIWEDINSVYRIPHSLTKSNSSQMVIVAERCPQGHPVINAVILVDQFINTWPRKPCCFPSRTHKQDKKKNAQSGFVPQIHLIRKPVVSNHLRRPLLECPGLSASPLSILSAREKRGTHLVFLGLYSGRGKMRLWKLVSVGNPAVTSLDLHWPACHWSRKKEKEED